MKKVTSYNLNNLYVCLDDLIKSYRQLLNSVRKEREILTNSDLDALNENNRIKDGLIIGIQRQESQRKLVAKELGNKLEMDSNKLRLLDFFKYFEPIDGVEAKRLESYHQVLDLLVHRVKAYNLENEALVKSALKTVTGAMRELSGVSEDKSIYRCKGELGEGVSQSGRFVSREA